LPSSNGEDRGSPILKSLLRDDPSEEVIDAVSLIADEECAVLLGRIARSRSVLADAALISLENSDHARGRRYCGCDPAPAAATAGSDPGCAEDANRPGDRCITMP